MFRWSDWIKNIPESMEDTMDIIRAIEQEQLKTDLPAFGPGDTVKVHIRIKEGKRERVQIFEGVVLKRQGGGLTEMFTVRKISFGVGVEKTFPVHSPSIEKIDVTRRGKVRRAKLYYLRDRVGKAAKTKENTGARIENKEITVKEELAEEVPVEAAPEEAPAVETNTVETQEVVDTVKETPVETVKDEAEKAE